MLVGFPGSELWDTTKDADTLAWLSLVSDLEVDGVLLGEGSSLVVVYRREIWDVLALMFGSEKLIVIELIKL